MPSRKKKTELPHNFAKPPFLSDDEVPVPPSKKTAQTLSIVEAQKQLLTAMLQQTHDRVFALLADAKYAVEIGEFDNAVKHLANAGASLEEVKSETDRFHDYRENLEREAKKKERERTRAENKLSKRGNDEIFDDEEDDDDD